MPPKVAEVRALLADMPIEDQLGVLLIAIVEANGSAPDVSLRMVRAVEMLSKGLGTANRFRVSEAMRDVADVLERAPAVRIEIG